METRFRVIFAGRIQPGRDAARVKQAAAVRLKASPAQLEQLFALPRVILKKNVDAAYGHAYLQALEEIGMLAELEPMPVEPDIASTSAPPPTGDTTLAPAPAALTDDLPTRATTETGGSPIVPENTKPRPLAETTSAPTGGNLANTLTLLDAAYPPQESTATPVGSSYARMQANLARAEALLNVSHRPPAAGAAPQEISHDDMPVFTGTPEPAQTETPGSFVGPATAPVADTAMHMNIATPCPPAELPQPSPAKAPLLFRTTLECTTCGTTHVIEGRLMVGIVQSTDVHSKI